MRILPQASLFAEPTKPVPTVRGKILQVYGPKGGVGTTTIATNLALALHTPQTKTVLVDSNLQFGDVAVFLNEVGYRSIIDLAPRVNDLDQDVISSVITRHDPSGLDLMVAPNRPEMAEKVTGEEFYKVLQYLRRIYSYIVVDSSPALNEITLSVLDAMDILLLVTTQEIPSIKNSRLFLSVLDALHIQRQRVMFVMNRYDRQIALSPEKVGENLKQEVVCVIPADYRTALKSENQGSPFILTNREEPLSKAVVQLSELVKDRLNTLAAADTAQIKIYQK
jgi:pilus assembly protein CpaE